MPCALYLSSALRQIEARHATLPLMQRAGAAAAEWAMALMADQSLPVLVLAGPGNNGGDAFELATLLRQRFFAVHVVFNAPLPTLPKDAAAALERYRAAGGDFSDTLPAVVRWGLIVDGLFGIGLSRAPRGIHAEWIRQANLLAEKDHCPVLALDCPSGLNADTGVAFDPVIDASHTMTFLAAKPGLYTNDGPDHAGEISLADLGLPRAGYPAPHGRLIERSLFAPHLRPRHRNSHKGSFGSTGILGGPTSMLGAVILAGRAAIKLGSGRVYLGLLDQQAPSLDPAQPELMIRRPEAIFDAKLSALACGPGLGNSLRAVEILEGALASPLPLVLDADALSLIGLDQHLQALLSERSGPSLLTPHPAEAGRLLDCSVEEIQVDRIRSTCEIARRYHAHVALKGCGTVIAMPDGRWWINTTGNPGMATAGMGDVLTGLLAALLAQGWPPGEAMLAAVHVHGAAADRLVAQGIGPVGLTAGEVIDAARAVFNDWIAESHL